MQEKRVVPALYKNATLLVTDIMGFETMCVESKPAQITRFLNDFYVMVDNLLASFDCFKMEHNAESVLVSAAPYTTGFRHSDELTKPEERLSPLVLLK